MTKTLADMTPEERAECVGIERWKPIAGYKHAYEVSDHGNVRSLNRIIQKSNGGEYRKKGCTLKKKLTRTGYHIVTLWDTPKPKHYYVHRLVLEAFDRPRGENEVCRHLDDDKLNNCLWNLSWGTPAENNYDAVKNGVHPMANKKCCPRGHEFARWNCCESSLRQGKRDCLACSRARGYLKRHPELRGMFREIANRYFEELQKANQVRAWNPDGTPPEVDA